MSQRNAKVERLSLKNFTAFEDVNFDFCSGLNVLIGTNSTGKTLTLKLLYSLLKAHQIYCKNVSLREHKRDFFYSLDTSSLRRIFQIVEMEELVRFGRSSMKADLEFAGTSYGLEVEALEPAPGYTTKPGDSHVKISPEPLYIPSQEILSINQGFISLYQNRELLYDETYYDLSLALNALPLRNEKLSEVQEIIDFLRSILTGGMHSGDTPQAEKSVVTQSDGRFYFDLPEGRLETHLVAEGYRKIATLLYLLKNGSLTRDSILFWDEPEANLNPKLIVLLVEVLKKMIAAGMQIFISTHDYLLAHELSLLSEYQTEPDMDIKFFSLYRAAKEAGVELESGRTLAEITHNPILEEFAAHYDRESSLFQG